MDLYTPMTRFNKEDVSTIGEEVQAEYDNAQQSPLGFRWCSEHHEVLKLLLVLKNSEGHLEFFLRTDKGGFLSCTRQWK